jgi:hypothetical protein
MMVMKVTHTSILKGSASGIANTKGTYPVFRTTIEGHHSKRTLRIRIKVGLGNLEKKISLWMIPEQMIYLKFQLTKMTCLLPRIRWMNKKGNFFKCETQQDTRTGWFPSKVSPKILENHKN